MEESSHKDTKTLKKSGIGPARRHREEGRGRGITQRAQREEEVRRLRTLVTDTFVLPDSNIIEVTVFPRLLVYAFL